jgi:uncharacterized protein YndB with AHSA1/START domain
MRELGRAMTSTPAEPADPADLLLEKSLSYGLPADRLFELLVSEESVEHWMGAEVEIDPAIDGEVRVRVPGWPDVIGRINEMRAPERIRVRWAALDWGGPLTSTVELHDDANAGCRLSLRETGFGADDDLLRRRDWSWSHWLVRLSAAAAQLGSPGPR